MQISVSYEDMKKQVPDLVESVESRAKAVKNGSFDGSSDPQSWKWFVEVEDKFADNNIPALMYYNQPIDKNSPDVKSERLVDNDKLALSNEDFVKKYMSMGVINARLGVIAGKAKVDTSITHVDNLPTDLLEMYAMKENNAQPTNYKLLSVYKGERNPGQPGVAKVAIVAAFEKEDGQLMLLTKESNSMERLFIRGIDEKTNSIMTYGTILENSQGWDVEEGKYWKDVSTVGWKRISAEDIEKKFGKEVLKEEFDFDAWSNLSKGMALAAVFGDDFTVDARVVPFDADALADSVRYFEYGEELSDREFIENKWAMFDKLTPDGLDRGKKPLSIGEIIKNGDTEGLRIMIDEYKTTGAYDKIFVENNEEQNISTLLFHTAATGTPEMMQMLIDLGADPSREFIKEIAKGMFSHYPVMHNAIMGENTAVVKFMIEKGYEGLENRFTSAETWLMFAVTEGKLKSADMLLEMGADINATTFHGNTALHLAASKANASALEWLIKHDADPTIENPAGKLYSEMLDDGEEWNELYNFLEDYREAKENGTEFTLPEDFYDRVTYKKEDDAAEQQKNMLAQLLAKMPGASKKPSP